MIRTLRNFSLLLILGWTNVNAQAPATTRSECPGVPGACGYPAGGNQLHAPSPTNPTPQNGNGTLGVIYDMQKCGLDFASASQRIGQRFSPVGVAQPAPFVISGIPACAVIEKAYLWAEGSGNGAAQTATVNGPLGSANYPMTIVGSGPDKCWSYAGSYTYRADVTASVNGNGTYNVSGLLTSPPVSGNDMDGATLIVVWSLPSANWAGRIVIADGAIIVNGGIANYNMPIAPAVCGVTNNARAFFCIGDIQFNPTSWSANGTAVPLSWNWWDYEQVNTTVANGQATANYNINTGGDCFNLCVSGLYFRTTTCTTCPTTSSLTLTTSSTPASCSSCNGTATVTSVTGAPGPYTYSWAPSGGTGATASGLCAGTYTVTVTANGGCLTQTATVVVPGGGGSITINSVGQTNILCNGQCTGTATVSPSGGTAPYTYSWAPSGGTGVSASGLCAGTYTCTVTDANGCTGTRTFTITQPPVLSSTGAQTNVLCNGQCTGSATVTPFGGTAPYSYSWAPSGGTGATASALCAGTYTVTVTDANGCATTRTFSITQPTALSTTGGQTNILCFGQCTGTATVTPSGGTAPYSYSWAPSGGTGATASALCAGTYTVTVTDANGCTTTRTFNITQPPAGVSATGAQTNILCNGQCTGSATVTASGGSTPYTYAWTPSGGTSASASALCAGTYTCTVTDANGCTTTRTFTITQPPALSTTGAQTNVLCNGQCTGSATVTPSGGTAPYSYSWAPSGGTGASASALCAGTYTVTVTDANGCVITRTFTITQPTAITATTSFTSATCGGNNGTATVTPSGGTSPYTYSWSTTPVQTTQTATGLAAGTYAVTVTDANGCTASFSVTVPNAGSPTASIASSTNVTCFGLCNGTANGNATGGTTPYTYAWAPSGGTGINATGLCAGVYTFTVTDANGCSSSATVTITEPTAVTVSGAQTNVLCNGQCTGSATVTAGGGTAPYTYAWAPSGGTGATASALCAANYTCTVTDANGCTITQSFAITQPPALAIAPTQTNTSCNGSCDGSATATASGGTAPYTYAWAPSGGTGATENNLCAGTYTVTVTDANGCVLTQTYTITQPAAITATTSAVNSTCSQANGSATVNASGGTGAFTYSWNTTPVQTTQTATGLFAGPYTVTVTDANGCTASFSVTVVNDASPTATIQASADVTCFGACDGTATGSATGGTGGYIWSWNTTPVQTTAAATGLCAGSYICTVTDANGCTSTTNVTISEPTQLTSSTTSTDALCFAACNGSAIVTGTGGTGAYTYSWNTTPVQTTAAATSLCAGSYAVTVTDANGCTSVSNVTITEPPQLTLAIAGFNTTCNGACDGQVVVMEPEQYLQPAQLQQRMRRYIHRYRYRCKRLHRY
ncbi:MAG: hypothetical protein FD123_1423 [Bacteroidetes bacterium]|nr:MAG: hypothetical protein FD123_1423 [Bacteroidota bacterium]